MVTYSLTTSLDGFISGPDGSFDWGAPEPEVFRFATDEVAALGAHLLGRRLYEAMRYWETPEAEATFDAPEREFAELWKALPKVVFSSSLTSVEGSNTRLASGGLAEEIARLDGEVDGNIAVGGATLAAAAADLDLIDEYRIRVYPVLVGGGLPYFARDERFKDLELIESRALTAKCVFLHYRVVRAATPSA
jgi:dihydrofolate reductase